MKRIKTLLGYLRPDRLDFAWLGCAGFAALFFGAAWVSIALPLLLFTPKPGAPTHDELATLCAGALGQPPSATMAEVLLWSGADDAEPWLSCIADGDDDCEALAVEQDFSYAMYSPVFGSRYLYNIVLEDGVVRHCRFNGVGTL